MGNSIATSSQYRLDRQAAFGAGTIVVWSRVPFNRRRGMPVPRKRPPDLRALLSLHFLTLGLATSVFAADSKRIEALWADLEKGETEATRAVLKLSPRPRETVDFLKTKMKPLKLSS